MKKRYVLKNKRRFMLTLAVTISIISSIFLISTSKTEGYTEIEYNEIIITSGDTLWDIVSDVYGENSDIRKKVSMIKKANNLETAEIYAGQVLLLPGE